ncbi:MAG: hypothetical protein ACSHW0_11585 [Thalassotalea sp.]
MIDPYVLIKYPNDYYFYVNKTNYALAADLKKGLELALADGSFDKIFLAAYGDVLKKLNVDNRRVFNLHNPMLLESTPVDRPEFWVQLPNDK